jgi:hypothetical protein
MNHRDLIFHKDGNPEKGEEDIITDKVVGSIIIARRGVTLNNNNNKFVFIEKFQNIGGEI